VKGIYVDKKRLVFMFIPIVTQAVRKSPVYSIDRIEGKTGFFGAVLFSFAPITASVSIGLSPRITR
ncbi:MAG: hypothetical protein ACLFSU_05870, partial [Acholeplasmataceae bacterium]